MSADPTEVASTRSGGRSVQDYLDRDSRPVPATLREFAHDGSGPSRIPIAHYTSREWHQQETHRLWPRVWQMACHVSHIARPGDTYVYDIGELSLLIVRGEDGVIRAFHNSCLHRGTRLRDSGGNNKELRCPYHGWSWDLTGELRSITCAWDFAHVKPASYCLPAVAVEEWEGFVFVNFHSATPSLADILGNLPRHFERWRHADRHVTLHVGRVVRCNWKVALEAFIESYHVMATHPQQKSYISDADSQYDVWPDAPYWSRMITAVAVPGPHVDYAISEQQIANEMAVQSNITTDDGQPVVVPEGSTARLAIAEYLRQKLTAEGPLDVTDWTDSEVLDGIEYFVFPNFMPWGGLRNQYAYRFRPYGDDPEMCLLEAMFFAYNRGAEVPNAPPMRLLAVDEPFTSVAELGRLGEIFEQDWNNMTRVQQGLRSSQSKVVTLADYQESRIRHFHRTLQHVMGDEGLAP
jgi:phenylpropionate dioxygenase-like ring-hydroxylating dioxygenase large terminal subunit